MRLIPAALLSAVALASTASAAPPEPAHDRGSGPTRELTVATFNIHHGADGGDVLDLERIAHDIESFDADVIGLQEVDNAWGERSDHVDQAAWLADRLGMHYCYAPNLDLAPEEGRAERRQYGTAILSAYPLSDCTNTPLPNHEGGEQRGLASAVLKVRGVPVTFYNTHLTHQSAEYRSLQFEAINDILAEDGTPSVLTGDLNAAPDSSEYEVFTSELSDIWPTAGRGEGRTYEPGNPKRRIDYILASDDIVATDAHMPLVESSDHYPVVADLTLPHPGRVHAGR